MHKIFFLFSFLAIQTFATELPMHQICFTKEEIKIDGLEKERVWENTFVLSGFYNVFPDDTSKAKSKTELKVLMDENFLYLFVRCFFNNKKSFLVQSLRRDFSLLNNDMFGICIDPFNDKTNGFLFAVNPYGVQAEGLLANGGNFGNTLDWDNAWFAETAIYDDYWDVEIKIPLKSIRFKDGVNTWGLNFIRTDFTFNERSSWMPIPRVFSQTSLAFTSLFQLEQAPQKKGNNFSLIPFAIAESRTSFNPSYNNKFIPNTGLDGKVVLGSNLNIDLTVNPDFSQVEVDRQLTNLTRFSLFFPERRQFFLENSDLFSTFGFRQIRPFFSRQIGLSNGGPIPIAGGFRLSGKVNQNWRVGLMNLQTLAKPELDLNSENFTVGAFQRKLFTRSYISGIVVNKQTFEKDRFLADSYNTVVGSDLFISSKTNKLNGKIFYHQHLTSQKLQDSYAHASWLNYSTRDFAVEWNHEYVGSNYQPAVGFVPRNKVFDPVQNRLLRTAYWRLEPFARLNFYPRSNIMNNYSFSTYFDWYWNSKLINTDRLSQLNADFYFQNTSHIRVAYQNIYTRLFYQFNVTGRGDFLLPGEYNYNNFLLQYNNDSRKKFNVSCIGEYGSFFGGIKYSSTVDFAYRYQPYMIFACVVNYNNISIKEKQINRELWLIGPRIDLTFTKKLFITSFFQYNTQIENVNVNTRLQYRFKPMSDIFLVYTDDYNSTNLSVKNRSVVIKFVYWLNV